MSWASGLDRTRAGKRVAVGVKNRHGRGDQRGLRLSRHIGLTSLAFLVINVVVAATGYLREFVLAHTFGVGTEMDAFYFCLALVQATHDLIFGAVLTATIVPLLHRRDEGKATAVHDPARFTVTVALTVAMLASALAIVLRTALPYLIDALSPKMSVVVRAQCLVLGTALVWLLPLNALTNVGVLVMNAYRRFILAASIYFFINLVFVAVLLLVEPIAGVNALSVAILAGPLFALPYSALAWRVWDCCGHCVRISAKSSLHRSGGRRGRFW